MAKRALYLSGGGARGAYQAGVLKGIQHIVPAQTIPVDILSCVSAGAINAAFIATYADDYAHGITKLAQLWSSLHCDNIYQTNVLALLKSLLKNFFGIVSQYQAKGGRYILDTAPLKELLEQHLDFKKVNQHIKNGLFSVFEVATTCYDLAEVISFYHSHLPQPGWQNIRHIAHPCEINCQHILASAAFPLFFPTVEIDGLNFGDGSLRLSSPLRASIKLGADKLLIIATRAAADINPLVEVPAVSSDISFSKIIGGMLNALFLDSLDRDLELLKKINRNLAAVPADIKAHLEWRNVEILDIRPTADLGKIAENYQHALPKLLSYTMTSLGSKGQSGDFLSFMLFEAEYCKQLVDLGYQDALMNEERIREFFKD